jgi:hypothetical protein
MSFLSIEVRGDFKRLGKLVEGYRRNMEGDLLNRVGQREAKLIRDRIRIEKATPEGLPWPPRVSGRFNHPLLQKTGALVRGIRAHRESRTSVQVLSTVPYSRPVNALRKFWGLSTSDVENISRLVDDWVRSRFI